MKNMNKSIMVSFSLVDEHMNTLSLFLFEH